MPVPTGTFRGSNAVLRPLGRRLGPDPASADVATIGGVIANNAGGMRHPYESFVFLLEELTR